MVPEQHRECRASDPCMTTRPPIGNLPPQEHGDRQSCDHIGRTVASAREGDTPAALPARPSGNTLGSDFRRPGSASGTSPDFDPSGAATDVGSTAASIAHIGRRGFLTQSRPNVGRSGRPGSGRSSLERAQFPDSATRVGAVGTGRVGFRLVRAVMCVVVGAAASRLSRTQLVMWVRGWELWTFSTCMGRTWMLVGEAAVLVWTILACVAAFAQGPPNAHSWTMFVLTASVTAIHIAATRTSEERRRVDNLSDEHIDHTGIWTVSAAVLLPAHLLVVLILAIRLQRWFAAHKPPMRVVFGTAGILGSALSANAVTAMTPLRHWVTGEHSAVGLGDQVLLGVWLAVAGGVYFVVQTVLLGVVRGIWLSWTWQNIIGGWKENVDFVATVTFGLIAAVLKFTSPSLVFLVAVVAVLWTRNSREFHLVAYEARRDVLLTELYNRRGFDEQVRLILASSGEFGISAAVLMLDLDYFKKVNDVHGHPNGDQVLLYVAGALSAQIRECDLLCRIGGEEIAAFLPNTSLAEAIVIAERMRVAVAELEVPATRAADGEHYIIDGLSVSIGVAIYPSHGATIAELEKAADAAVYDAKRAGRNRVCLAPLPDMLPGTT